MKNENQNHKWWSPIPRFLAHTVVGSVIFIIVASPAVGLDLLVHWLEGKKVVSAFTITVLTFLEHAIFVLDVGVLLVYLVYAAHSAIKENGQK